MVINLSDALYVIAIAAVASTVLSSGICWVMPKGNKA